MAEQVFLRHRFLDPVQIVRREPLDAAGCLRRIERLIEIDHQRDVGAEQSAHARNHALIIGGIAVAALDLDAAKTLIERTAQRFFIRNRIDHAIAVIGLDRSWRAAEQFDHRFACDLTERIPIGHVETAHRHADEALPPEQPEFRIHRRHQIVWRDWPADEFAADLFDQMNQRLHRHLGVGEDVRIVR